MIEDLLKFRALQRVLAQVGSASKESTNPGAVFIAQQRNDDCALQPLGYAARLLAWICTVFIPSQRASFAQNAIAIIAVACCTLLWGTRAIPVTDRDEPRFAQASRQMLESETLAGWVIPRVGEEIRLKKPPLIYWAQAGTVAAATGGDTAHDSIWMYRLTSVIAATLAALATCWIGRAMFAGSVGLLAGLLLVVSPVVVMDCHMARADELLLAMTTIAMAFLWWLWSRHREDRKSGVATGGLPLLPCIGLWIFIALGVLTKGPITPFVAGTAVIAVAVARREWRFILRIRPFTGALVLLIVALPWLWLAVREVGFDTLRAAFEREVLNRASEGAEGHAFPPGYYLVTLVVFFFPGSLLVALAFGRLFTRAFTIPNAAAHSLSFVTRTRMRLFSVTGCNAEIFLLAWCVPTWLAFELIMTKLPHYILPIYPAIALFTARAIIGGVRSLPTKVNAMDRFGFGAWLVVGLCLLLAGPALFLVLQARGFTTFNAPSWPLLHAGTPGLFAIASLATALAGALMMFAWKMARDGAFVRSMQYAIPATVLTEMALLGVWLPQTTWIWNTPRVVGMMVQDSKRTPSDVDFPRLGAIGYIEDSLIFTTRNRLDRLHEADLGAWMTANHGAYLFVPSAMSVSLSNTATQSACALREVGKQRGFNYANGDDVEQTLYHVTQLLEAAPRPQP